MALLGINQYIKSVNESKEKVTETQMLEHVAKLLEKTKLSNGERTVVLEFVERTGNPNNKPLVELIKEAAAKKLNKKVTSISQEDEKNVLDFKNPIQEGEDQEGEECDDKQQKQKEQEQVSEEGEKDALSFNHPLAKKIEEKQGQQQGQKQQEKETDNPETAVNQGKKKELFEEDQEPDTDEVQDGNGEDDSKKTQGQKQQDQKQQGQQKVQEQDQKQKDQEGQTKKEQDEEYEKAVQELKKRFGK